MDEKDLTPRECAKELGVPVLEVYRAIHRGELIAYRPSERALRVQRSHLAQYREFRARREAQQKVLLTIEQVAENLDFNPETVRELTNKPDGIRAVKIGRRYYYSEEDIQAFKKSRQEAARTARPEKRRPGRQRRTFLGGDQNDD